MARKRTATIIPFPRSRIRRVTAPVALPFDFDVHVTLLEGIRNYLHRTCEELRHNPKIEAAHEEAPQ